MLFNFGKCKCLHTGHGKLDVNYKLGDNVLGTTVKEKDLGVTISADMKVSELCCIAASKGNQILGLIRRNITYKDKKLMFNNLTRLPSHTTSSWWQLDKEAIGLSRVQQLSHLCVAHPYQICVNYIFKHIHTTSINTIIWQFVPFIYQPL